MILFQTVPLRCIFIVATFVVLFRPDLKSQVSAQSASGNCACDGSIQYTAAQIVSASLLNDLGSVLSSQNNVSGLVNFSGLCPGVYRLQVTEGAAVNNYAVNVGNGAFNPGSATNLSLCSSQGVVILSNQIAGLIPGGEWTNPSGVQAGTTFNPSSSAPGLYVYTVDNNGCNVQTGLWIEIIQNSNPGLSTTYLICEDYNPFLMTDLLAGNPDYNGQWYNASNQPISGTFNPATMNSGLFTYMVPGQLGCPNVFSTLYVDENQYPNAGTDASIVVCTAASPFSMINYLGNNPDPGGQWFGPNGSASSATFNAATMQPGIYRYHVNGQTPCADRDSYLTISFIADDPNGSDSSVFICPGAAAVNLFSLLGGSPQIGGTWRAPDGTITDDIFDPATDQPGGYRYAFPGVVCTPGYALVTIYIDNAPTAGPDVSFTLCENTATFNLSSILGAGAAPGGTFRNSSGNPTGPTISIYNDGIFNYTYTVGSAGCGLDQANITLNIQPLNTPPPPSSVTLCSSDPAFDLRDLYPSYSSIVFTTNNGITISPIVVPSITSSASVQAVLTSQNSCPSTSAPVTITIEQPLFLADSDTFHVCITAGNLDLRTLRPEINYETGTWYNAAGGVISPDISLNQSGISNFTFVQPPSAACGSATLYIALVVDTVLNAGPDGSFTFCSNHAPVALQSLLPATAFVSGQWFVGGSPYNANDILPASSSSDVYSFVAGSEGACPPDVANLDITIIPSFPFTAGQDISTCSLNATQTIGGASYPGVNYQWSPASGLSDPNISNPEIILTNNNNSPIESTYYLTATDGTCTSTDSINIQIFPVPQPISQDTFTICVGDSVQLALQGADYFLWQPFALFPQNNIPNPIVIPTSSTSVYVQASNQWQCMITDTIQIVVHPLPDIEFEVIPDSSCPPLVTDLKALVPYDASLEWFANGNNIGVGDSLRMVWTQSGEYLVDAIATSSQGCSLAYQVQEPFVVFPSPVVSISANPPRATTLNNTVDFYASAINASSYRWAVDSLPLSTESQFRYSFYSAEPATYLVCVEVRSSAGCADTACMYLQVENEGVVYVPSAFTPDDDGINDVFKVTIAGIDRKEFQLIVQDRWGNKIFETTNPDEGWMGNVNGGQYYAQPDVYIWQLRVRENNMTDFSTYRGHVTLMR